MSCRTLLINCFIYILYSLQQHCVALTTSIIIEMYNYLSQRVSKCEKEIQHLDFEDDKSLTVSELIIKLGELNFLYTIDPVCGICDYYNFNPQLIKGEYPLDTSKGYIKGDCDDAALIVERFCRRVNSYEWVRKYFLKKHSSSIFGHIICIAKLKDEESYHLFDWNLHYGRNKGMQIRECDIKYDLNMKDEYAFASIEDILLSYEKKTNHTHTLIPLYFNHKNQYLFCIGNLVLVYMWYRIHRRLCWRKVMERCLS